MGMMPTLYTVNGLATELRMDRRGVAQRLRDVPPDGQINRRPAWQLTTALRAIRPERNPAGHGVRRTGGPFGSDRHPFVDGMLISHNLTVYCLPMWVAETAVAAGLSMTKAYELADGVTRAMMAGCREMMGEVADEFISPSGRSFIHEKGRVAPVAWRELRERTGEPDWTPPAPPVPGFQDPAAVEARLARE